MVIMQMYEKEFAINITSIRRCHQISSEIVWHVVEVSHYYLSVSVQTFKSGAFSHTLLIFILPCFSFKHNIILMYDAQKSFLEHYNGKPWCYTSKEDEYCVLKKVQIQNPLWIWYTSFGKLCVTMCTNLNCGHSRKKRIKWTFKLGTVMME